MDQSTTPTISNFVYAALITEFVIAPSGKKWRKHRWKLSLYTKEKEMTTGILVLVRIVRSGKFVSFKPHFRTRASVGKMLLIARLKANYVTSNLIRVLNHHQSSRSIPLWWEHVPVPPCVKTRVKRRHGFCTNKFKSCLWSETSHSKLTHLVLKRLNFTVISSIVFVQNPIGALLKRYTRHSLKQSVPWPNFTQPTLHQLNLK